MNSASCHPNDGGVGNGDNVELCGDESGDVKAEEGKQVVSGFVAADSLNSAPATTRAAQSSQDIAKPPPKSFHLMLSLNEHTCRIEMVDTVLGNERAMLGKTSGAAAH